MWIGGGQNGSSPLTRGKRGCVSGVAPGDGLIPAHAGKTESVRARDRLPGAHPRSRGENSSVSSQWGSSAGSSPLTRGKRTRTARRIRHQRLIPAHAGKTGRGLPNHGPGQAHPRSRGENQQAYQSRARDIGSSPLTRGKLRARVLQGHEGGLIPAHAGKTRTRRGRRRSARAHPRSRGENPKGVDVSLFWDGSSPLTRGKRPRAVGFGRGGRLIPAHAGKTCPSRWVRPGVSAHPRSRGENRRRRGEGLEVVGSSPLTRGKRLA